MGERLVIGAMSGTSADGVDLALVAVNARDDAPSAQLLAADYLPYSRALREQVLVVRRAGHCTLAALADLGREVTLVYSRGVSELLASAGVGADRIACVAAHGQTLFHDPPLTLQWFDPSLLAVESGIAVVSDFRRADCAVGGQGAPLVPYADYWLFSHPSRTRVMLNLGGIANLTFLKAGGRLDEVIAFDTGPANCLSDALLARHDPRGPAFDAGGQRAAAGRPIEALVERVLEADYFRRPPPKSTDGPAMVGLFDAACAELAMAGEALDRLLASAAQVVAHSVLRAVERLGKVDELIVSGGGVENQAVMRELGATGIAVRRVDELGLPSASKEAVAFAMLGAATLDGRAANVPSATGASRAVVLGSITPATAGR